jgi:hypothetical protein
LYAQHRTLSRDAVGLVILKGGVQASRDSVSVRAEFCCNGEKNTAAIVSVSATTAPTAAPGGPKSTVSGGAMPTTTTKLAAPSVAVREEQRRQAEAVARRGQLLAARAVDVRSRAVTPLTPPVAPPPSSHGHRRHAPQGQGQPELEHVRSPSFCSTHPMMRDGAVTPPPTQSTARSHSLYAESVHANVVGCEATVTVKFCCFFTSP